MRIAVVYDCLYPWTTGGAERLFRSYAEEWVAAGHDVTYLTRRQWDEDEAPAVPGVEVEAIAGRVELYDADGARRPGPAVAFAAAVGWGLLRRRGRFDAVYVSAIPPLNVLAAVPALLGSRSRVVVDWLEIWRPEQWVEYSGGLAGRVARVVQSLAVRSTRRAVCYSRLHADRLRAAGFRGRLFQAPGLLPGPTEAAAPPPQTTPAREATHQLLFVGRHIPDKRVEQIPEVVAELRGRGLAVVAVVVGEGQTRSAAESRARELGVAAWCSFVGFVDQDRLDELMRTSSCLVNPSIREGYGLVVVEAASVGTPSVAVVALDNAAAELVHDGVNGYRATSHRSLADAVAQVLEGGEELRGTTYEWFRDEARHGTVQATARGLVADLLEQA